MAQTPKMHLRLKFLLLFLKARWRSPEAKEEWVLVPPVGSLVTFSFIILSPAIVVAAATDAAAAERVDALEEQGDCIVGRWGLFEQWGGGPSDTRLIMLNCWRDRAEEMVV